MKTKYEGIIQNLLCIDGDFLEVIPIYKGYSDDLKYLLITKTGEKYLARITESNDIRVLNTKRTQYELMRELRQYSGLVPQVYQFWSDSASSCVMILAYVDGEDGEESLLPLSRENQYEIGYQAGEELRKLHQLAAPPSIPSWDFVKRKKYAWYCNEFEQNSLEAVGIELEFIYDFIKKHLSLIENTRSTFLHDDYHPGNLIIQDGHLNGIIDFNRCDWGDPIHDFYKVAIFTRNISIPFACGQIDGYHHGLVPHDFWERYALYCAMSIIPDIVWSAKYSHRTGSPDEREKSIHRNQIMYVDHDGFSSLIPRWYTGK